MGVERLNVLPLHNQAQSSGRTPGTPTARLCPSRVLRRTVREYGPFRQNQRRQLPSLMSPKAFSALQPSLPTENRSPIIPMKTTWRPLTSTSNHFLQVEKTRLT